MPVYCVVPRYRCDCCIDPAQVHVTVARSLDKIEITVTNPYHGGASGTAGNRMALDNIRERLALLFDVEAQLTTTINGKAFEAKLFFPYVKGAA